MSRVRGGLQRLKAGAMAAGRWGRAHPLLAVVLAAALLLFGIVRVLAFGTAGVSGLELGFREGAGDDLVVLVHGLKGREHIRGVIDVVREHHPDADLLIPEFPAGVFSNADPWLIASAIEIEIDQRDRARAASGRPYERIVLVGFSLGSLVVRKAYVWGHGGELTSDRPVGPQPRRPWVDRVERIVLLAGINRGWSISSKIDEPGCRPIRADRRFGFWLGKKLGKLTGTGGLILAIERGAPFVADLRVQWIRLARPPVVEVSADEAAELQAAAPEADDPPSADDTAEAIATSVEPPPVAPVVQLLGDVDDIVTHCDDQDIASAKDFLFIPVRWTGHAGITEVASGTPDDLRPDVAQERRSRLDEALGWPIEDLRKQYPSLDPEEDAGVEHVVFVMHGIRDFGEWTTRIAEAMSDHPNGGDKVKIVPSSYGYFPMGSFLLLGERQKNVRWFMDQYTQEVARHPNAKISYVGHSNGTYLLASALERYRTLSVDRVLFAGSVVRSSFGWRRFMQGPVPRVAEVRNIVATDDKIVGIFPRFYELLTERSPIGNRGFFDLGAAGFRGFAERGINLEFADGGHGAALDEPEEIRAIAEFVLGDSTVEGWDESLSVFEQKDGVATVADWASKLCWLVWAGLAVLLVWAGRYSHRWVGRRWPRVARFGWLFFAFVLLVVLQTV